MTTPFLPTAVVEVKVREPQPRRQTIVLNITTTLLIKVIKTMTAKIKWVRTTTKRTERAKEESMVMKYIIITRVVRVLPVPSRTWTAWDLIMDSHHTRKTLESTLNYHHVSQEELHQLAK